VGPRPTSDEGEEELPDDRLADAGVFSYLIEYETSTQNPKDTENEKLLLVNTNKIKVMNSRAKM